MRATVGDGDDYVCACVRGVGNMCVYGGSRPRAKRGVPTCPFPPPNPENTTMRREGRSRARVGGRFASAILCDEIRKRRNVGVGVRACVRACVSEFVSECSVRV